jgi:hypothetical protein
MQFAPRLLRAGFAVLPAAGKMPMVRGFNRWVSPPSLCTILEWARQKPNADIVYVPALSRPKGSREGIVVVDGDDEEACAKVVQLFGDTPGKVKTRRGQHFLYRDPGVALRKITSLKKFGINADLKHGKCIVVGPPSRHATEPSFQYTWCGCDEGVINELPPFDQGALFSLIESCPTGNPHPNVNYTAPRPGRLHEGSRGLGLNRFLCSQAWSCDSFEDLLDCARWFVSGLVEDGYETLSENEIVQRTQAVWNDLQAGKLQRWLGRSAVARSDAEEVKALSGEGKNGGDAFMLLMLLRAEHLTRVLRGETFALNPKAMAKAKTLDWSRERFENAIRLLMRAGYIKQTAPGRNTRHGRTSAQYTLVLRQ